MQAGAGPEKGDLREFWKMSVLESFSWGYLGEKERPEENPVPPPPKISQIRGANALPFREGIFINPLRESGIEVQRKHCFLSNLNCRNSWDYRTMHCSKLFIAEPLFHPT